MALPQDNWVVFQVRVDGVPMKGHAAGLSGVTEPVVFDPDEGGANYALDSDFSGFNFWLDKLNMFGGDFRRAEMVKAFLFSIEYRSRFGQP
jgi:hypothetical protein